MAKPAILTIDDEPQVLSAIERDLRRQFGGDYRVIKASSGAEALNIVQRLKQRNDPLALFLVDQRMPEMTGIEFLEQAIKYYPNACKVLLTAYADTEAAIASINRVGLDHYLLKPWDPPEVHLYPILTGLLDDWAAAAEIPFQGIRIAGTLWSASSHAVKDFLARNQIPYQWLDIEKDEEARLLVEGLNANRGSGRDGVRYRLPVVFFPDGDMLIEPSPRDLAERIGFRTRAAQPFYDLVIVGAGPAGLAAAVYGASEGLRTLMVEKEAAGGQAGTSSRIENYLGFPNGLTGADLARRALSQARRFGAEILADEVSGIQTEEMYRIARLSSGESVSCHALLLAAGVTVRRLEAPGVAQLTGAGVYYGAALTEAAFYRGQDIFVVGGANSAGQAALYFSGYANKVTMVVRSSSLAVGMSRYLVDQIEVTPNIETLFDSEVTRAIGTDRLEGLEISDRISGESITRPAAALFIFIGAVPHTDMVAGLVGRDRAGFILTGPDLLRDGKRPSGWNLKRDPFLLETSCPGIFAAGDVRHGSIKRVASAVGEGAVAVSLIHQYLKTV